MTDRQNPEPERTDSSIDRPASQTFDDRDRARVQLPTREQLLHLIDRAERHVLTPTEGHLLRVGVTHLASQLGGAGAAIRRLTGERDEARRERDKAVRELALSGPQVVDCPFCGAAAGERCRSVRGAEPPRQPHAARLTASRQWVFEQALDEAS